MCSCCKMDDADVKIMRQRQGAVEIEDFDEVLRYRRPKKKNKKKVKTRPGCPGNNYGPHVYVWTTEGQDANFFSDYFGFFKFEYKTCAGCHKTNGSRNSERYEKIKSRKWEKKAKVGRGEPVPRTSRYNSYRYWSWEREDEEYMKAYRAYIKRNGWPTYLYYGM